MLTWNNVGKEILGGISLLELSWPSQVHTDEEGFRQELTLELDLKYEWTFLPTERHPQNPKSILYGWSVFTWLQHRVYKEKQPVFLLAKHLNNLCPKFFFTNWLPPSESRCEQDGDFCDHLGSNFSMQAEGQPVCLSIPSRRTYLWEKEAALSVQIIQCSSIFTFSNVSAIIPIKIFYSVSRNWLLPPLF